MDSSTNSDTDANAHSEEDTEEIDGTDPEAASELDSLRSEVEAKYDFDNFRPADMAQMSADEWEAVFDADSWITGPELIDRVEKDLKNKIARRDIFGVFERETVDGVDRLLVYSDEGYAIVDPDGTVEGEGGVLRDLEPVVALCSMDEYEIAEPPEQYQLPSPEAVPEQTGELGNLMVQVIAGMQLLGGLGLIGAWLLTDVDTLVAPVIGGLFLAVGIFLFSLVANARLSDRFRAEQYRNRLRAVETDGFDRPDLSGETAPESTALDDQQESRDHKTEGA
jgi:hypothetical protein